MPPPVTANRGELYEIDSDLAAAGPSPITSLDSDPPTSSQTFDPLAFYREQQWSGIRELLRDQAISDIANIQAIWNQAESANLGLDSASIPDNLVLQLQERQGVRQNSNNPSFKHVSLDLVESPAQTTGPIDPLELATVSEISSPKGSRQKQSEPGGDVFTQSLRDTKRASSHRKLSTKHSSYKDMPPAAAPRGRPSEDSQTPHAGGKSSRASTVSTMSPALYSEENAKPDAQERERTANSTRVDSRGIKRSILRHNQVDSWQDMSAGLAAEKGFPIQIGSELFRLSGASIMSDAPSYFSKFFEDQLRKNEDGGVKTLYIDRDPGTFQDIARHLQGYHVQPRDGQHYVRLFADAQFYGLPQLMKQLFDSEIFIQIGEQNFQIPRNIFSSPGDSPNFFSLGFAAFFNSPDEVFPGLDRFGLLRPPAITPPSVQNRSAQVFSELLHLLRGYPLHIRSKEHRAELLRDCRYFHLRGLEQKLIMHHVSYNSERQKSEILLRLEDIRQSGVSFVGDASPSDRSPLGGWVNYMRPFVDELNYELIVEIGDESLKLDFRSMRGEFYGDAKARITSLFQVVANKMNLPTNLPLGLLLPSGGIAAQPVSPGNTPLSQDKVKFWIEGDAHILLDGEEHIMDRASFDAYDNNFSQDPMMDGSTPGVYSMSTSQHATPGWSAGDLNSSLHPHRPSSTRPTTRKRKRRGSLDEFGEWVIRKGQWRLRVQPRPEQLEHEEQKMEIVLHAVKLDAVSGQKGRNTQRSFLS